MNKNRLEELAAAWSIENPDPVLRTELEDLLRRDPTARRRFLDYCVSEMALVESLASAAAAVKPAVIKPAAGNRPRRHPSRRTVWPNRLWATGLVAAALIIGIISLLVPGDQSKRITSGSLVVDNRTISTGAQVEFPLTNAKAGENGVEIIDPAGINFRAAPGSNFAITASGAIELTFGQIILDVESGRAPPTVVRTNELIANVIGTRFIVTRNSDWSEVEVERGQVNVNTAKDDTVHKLKAGAHIAADQLGLIIVESPSDPNAIKPTLNLVLIANDGSERSRHETNQPIHLPANQPFTLRAEVSKEVVALRFKLANQIIMNLRTDGLERISPFYLWGDFDFGKRPNFSQLPPGTHRLTITSFADERGVRLLDSRVITLIAE